jgi:hypothetical protein
MADLTTATIGGGSSELVKRNPQYHVGGTGPTSLDLSVPLYNGNKPLTFFELDFGTAVNTQVNPEEAINVCIEIVQKYATIVIRGDLHSTNQVMTFAIETPNDSLDWDGNGAETLVEQIEDEIIALGNLSAGTPNQIDYRNVTCTVKTSLNLA